MTEPEQTLVNVADLRDHRLGLDARRRLHAVALHHRSAATMTAACLTNWTNVAIVFVAFIAGGAAFGAVVGWVSK